MQFYNYWLLFIYETMIYLFICVLKTVSAFLDSKQWPVHQLGV